ncbi:MAG: N-acetylmuramoyl-L-alanine amidase [Clostridia bacterium]|nr:N-acetylmuramoyl-L-alanine amidase [Clostridia bacterium]
MPGTEVTEVAYASLLNLVTDICKRNGIAKLVWSANKADRVGHLNGCNMTVHRDYANKSCPGEWLYSRHAAIATEVNKRLGASTTTPQTDAKTPAATTAASYTVRIKATGLRIRKGPGTNYGIAQNAIAPGVYTIVAESSGTGSTKGWGKLKSGAGWISLNYATKI